MSLRQLKLDMQAAKEFIMHRQALSFTHERTTKGNLRLIFNDGNRIRLPIIDMRPHQLKLQHKLFIEKYDRVYVWRPRRAGKEVESWNMIIQGALTEPGLYLMVYPTNVRARMILWDGAIVMPDGTSLKFLDMIPKELLAGKPKQDSMTINLINGSVIRVIGSDIDPGKLRGINARGVVMSEYAFCDPRVRLIMMPMLRQNGGWLILQTTPNGMNHAYDFMQEMKSNPDWFCQIDTADTLVDEFGNPFITQEMIDEDRRAGMPDWMIAQEYYCDVQVNLETLYFSNEMKFLRDSDPPRIIEGLRLADKPVYAFFDIGINDSCGMALVQFNLQGDPYAISYHENNNKAFEYYVRWAEAACVQRGLHFKEIYVPHDGQKRDFNTGKNTVDFGNDLGYNVYVVPRPTAKFSAIQSMRRLLYRTYFDKDGTHRLRECLSNYSKEYDQKRGVYKDQPLHNWASHGVDCYQTLALAMEASMISTSHTDIVYYHH